MFIISPPIYLIWILPVVFIHPSVTLANKEEGNISISFPRELFKKISLPKL